MHKLSTRETKIVKLLLSSVSPITSIDLSSTLKISSKTIRNDIARINNIFNPIPIQSSNKGYSITRGIISPESYNEEETGALVDEKLIIRKLLLDDRALKFSELAEEFNVSESYLQKWVYQGNILLGEFNLNIKRQKGMISIEGKETNVRALISKMIQVEISEGFNKNGVFTSYYQEITDNNLLKKIGDYLDESNCYIAPYYETSINLSLFAIIDRIVDEQTLISASSYDFSDHKNDNVESKIAAIVSEYIFDEFGIKISKSECKYIEELFIGQVKKISSQQSEPSLDEDFISNIKKLLQESFDYFRINIDYSDFLYVFASHVFDMIKRYSNDLLVPNFYLDTLKENSPFIYDVAIHIGAKIERKFNIEVSEEEISLIAIHIGYSIDNSLSNKTKVKAVIVNGKHQNFSRLILHKIVNRFRDSLTIIDMIDDGDILELSSLNPNTLYITTIQNVPLRDNIVVISPIASNNDLNNISNMVNVFSNMKNRLSLLDLIKKFTDVDFFYSNYPENNYYDVMNLLNDKLIRQGLVSNDFIVSVSEREEMSSTAYFERFAFPHALNYDAKKTMISVLLSDQPLDWNGHVVYCVFLICINSKDTHFFSKLYDGLVAALLNDSIYESIKKSKSYDEFIQCFEQ